MTVAAVKQLVKIWCDKNQYFQTDFILNETIFS